MNVWNLMNILNMLVKIENQRRVQKKIEEYKYWETFQTSKFK